jgi:hypothetical protein
LEEGQPQEATEFDVTKCVVLYFRTTMAAILTLHSSFVVLERAKLRRVQHSISYLCFARLGNQTDVFLPSFKITISLQLHISVA